MENKKTLDERYSYLKSRIKERKKEFDAFIEMLEEHTSWLTSPASTRYHLNEEKGLLIHSISVAENLIKFKDFLTPQITDESCVIVGLFHDVGKVGMPGQPLYIKNDNEWEIQKRNIKYKTNQALPHMSLGARSLYLVTKYIPLTDAEAQAILYHDGQYVDENKTIRHKEEPLTLLAHWADYWTAHIYEEGRRLKDEIDYYDKYLDEE